MDLLGTVEGIYYLPLSKTHYALTLPGLTWCKGSVLWPVKCQYRDGILLAHNPGELRQIFKVDPLVSEGLTKGLRPNGTTRELDFFDLVQSLNFWGSIYQDGARKWIAPMKVSASAQKLLEITVGYFEAGVPLGMSPQNFLTVPGMATYNKIKYILMRNEIKKRSGENVRS